jgi:uncharacterized OsmC-like protein
MPTIRGQHVVTGSPPTLGGPNEAANPVALLLAALAGCAVFDCAFATKEMGIALAGVSVTAAGDLDPRGVCGEAFDPRFQDFRIRLVTDGTDATQAQALLAAIKARCPVCATSP